MFFFFTSPTADLCFYSWITIVNNRMNVQRSRKRRTIGEMIGIVIVQIYICFLPSLCTGGRLPMPKFGRLPVGNKIRGPCRCGLVLGTQCVLKTWQTRDAGKGLWVESVCLSLSSDQSFMRNLISVWCVTKALVWFMWQAWMWRLLLEASWGDDFVLDLWRDSKEHVHMDMAYDHCCLEGRLFFYLFFFCL